MITVEIKEDEISAALDRLARALTDMTPVMQDAGEYLVSSTEERMDSGLSPDGTPFAPRSEATLDAYRRAGESFGAVPLQKTRTMRNTLSYQAEPDAVRWGSNAIQAAVMQFGAAQGTFGSTSRDSPIPWGDIPARPFLGVSAEDRDAIVELVEEWLSGEATGGSGL